MPEFNDRFVWSVNIKSTQEKLLVIICVSSFVNLKNPFEEVLGSNLKLEWSATLTNNSYLI